MKYIYLSILFLFYINSVFSQGKFFGGTGSGYNSKASNNIALSVNNNLNYSDELTIFPNPFNTSTTLQFNSSIKNAELNIYNLYGQKVKTINNISGDQIKIERRNLNAGSYFYELKQDNKNIVTGKLIIAD